MVFQALWICTLYLIPFSLFVPLSFFLFFPCSFDCLKCFQAWALFKGKFREGIDKPDPPTWKTRLRCALNKSNDFEELVERSQLDISDPYKVYRIVPEGAKKGKTSQIPCVSVNMSHFKQMRTKMCFSGMAPQPF